MTLETRSLMISSSKSIPIREIASKMVKEDLEGTVVYAGLSTTRQGPGKELQIEETLKIVLYNGGSFEGLWPWLKATYGLGCGCTWVLYHTGHSKFPLGWREPPHCIEGREECRCIHKIV